MIFLGIIAGIFTGLIPGVHINLIASIILINFVLLNSFLEINALIIFILAMSVTHSFVDFIPSICFGVPSEDTCLSVLPAHRLVLKGEAYKAIFLSAIGSLFGVFFIFLISPLFYYGLKWVYENVKFAIPYILLTTSIGLILNEKTKNKKFWALIVGLLSGSFGMFILNSYLTNNPLLILFTGMFGVTSIIYSLAEDSKMPKQSFLFDFKIDKDFIKSIFVGGFASSICCVSPGMGNAQAGTIASLFYKNISAEIFIVVLSVINTINFVLSIITLYLIDKARNGAILVVSQITEAITFNQLIFFMIIVLLVSFIGFFLTCILGKKIIKIVSRINMRIVNVIILVFLFGIVFVLTDLIGLVILLTSMSLGFLVNSLGVRRVHLMNVLLVPVIMNLI